MTGNPHSKLTLLNGSHLIVEACARAGADVYVGYPITPSNDIYYYSSLRMPALLSAPDEITTLQWMAGLSAAGALPGERKHEALGADLNEILV